MLATFIRYFNNLIQSLRVEMGKQGRNKNFGHRNKPYHRHDKRDNFGRNMGKRNPQERRQEFVPKVNLREDQVGITEFISKTEGFTGVVKSRYSDFHVNEIDLNGKVLQLDDLTIPHPVEETLTTEEVEAAREELKDVITAELWKQISDLAEAKAKDSAPIEIDVSTLDKEKRTQIHMILKKLYAGKLVSTTLNLECAKKKNTDDADATEVETEQEKEKKLIKIMKPKGGRDLVRNRWTFPGEYVYFLIHKENMDTSEIASALADRLNLRPSQVNYCGTKDKRAKTTQKFCIKRRLPSHIFNCIKSLHNVHVGNFEFGSEVLKLGNLKGNRFRIALRHVSGDQEKIEVALQQLRENGFINYFGLQRFGNCATIPTYEVGVALLKSDYKLACELILKPRDNDVHFMRAIRETWWKDRNSTAAASMFRNDKFIEKKLLDGLSQYGENDYAGALRKIPRNMLLLYPHSFQSLIFNRMASRRIQEFGLKLIPGDLVYRNKDELDLDTTEVPLAEDEPESSEVEETTESNEPTDDNVDDAATITTNTTTTTESIFKRKVKSLTADDIASGNYTLFDVVLPLPGYDVTYPDNAVGTWYREILEECGLSSEKLRHNVKTYAMAGAYRKLIIQPTEMSWKFCTYNNAEKSLITSDWEALRIKKTESVKNNDKETNNKEDKEDGTADDGKFRALILDFCLPTSAYATMLLRELLKTDTSAEKQTQLEQTELKKATEKSSTGVSVCEKRKIDQVENIDGDNVTDDKEDSEVINAKKVKNANGE